MEIAVLGRKGLVSDRVRSVAQDKVAKLGRMAPVLDRAQVRLSEDRDAPGTSQHLCEVTMTGHGYTIRAKAVARDLVIAVDMAAGKLEHQVERLKGKLVARSHPRRSKDLSES